MKENQNTMIYSPETFWKESNPHNSESKEAYHLNEEHKGYTFPPYIELESGDAARWNPFLSNFSVENEIGNRDSLVVENPSGLPEKASMDLPSYILNEGEKVQPSSENVNECKDSSKTNAKSFSDKRAVGGDTLASTDGSKGMNEHVSKDVCVDEVESFRSCDDDQTSASIPNPSNKEGHSSFEEGPDLELLVSYQLKNSSSECSTANGSRSNGHTDSRLDMQESWKSHPQGSCSSVDLLQNDLANSEPVAKDAANVPDNVPVIDRMLPFQEYGSRSLSNDEATKATQISSRICSGVCTTEEEHVELIKFLEKEKDYDDLSPDEELEPASSKDTEHDNQNSSNVSDPNPGKKHEVEDTNFSKAKSITYSEPISHPGSVSMRSDGSISNRSFAFPILQSEWNSSPVKMAKADQRHFRKQRGWRSGVFCCRF